MGSSSFRELSMMLFRTSAYFMYKNIKINEKTQQILVDTGATFSTLNSTYSGACRLDPGKAANCDSPHQGQLSWTSAVPGWERKVKWYVVLSNPDSCEFGFGCSFVTNPFCPRDSYYFLVCLVLCPEKLAWLSACLWHAGCWFLHMQATQTLCLGTK